MKLFLDESGSVMVELALALPVLAVILAGAVDYALLLQRQARLQNAAAAATAWVTAPAHTNDLAGAQQLAQAGIADLAGAQVNVQRFWNCTPGGSQVAATSSCSGGRTPMQWVQADVYASAAPPMPFPGLAANATLHSFAVQRVLWMP